MVSCRIFFVWERKQHDLRVGRGGFMMNLSHLMCIAIEGPNVESVNFEQILSSHELEGNNCTKACIRRIYNCMRQS